MCIAENCINKPWKNGFCYAKHRKQANADLFKVIEEEICRFGGCHTITLTDRGIEIHICDRCQECEDYHAAELGDVYEDETDEIEQHYSKYMEWFGYDPREKYKINGFKIIHCHPDYEDIEDN
jgi:hypothetical protein